MEALETGRQFMAITREQIKAANKRGAAAPKDKEAA
jgi:hypothetical protein